MTCQSSWQKRQPSFSISPSIEKDRSLKNFFLFFSSSTVKPFIMQDTQIQFEITGRYKESSYIKQNQVSSSCFFFVRFCVCSFIFESDKEDIAIPSLILRSTDNRNSSELDRIRHFDFYLGFSE